MKILCSISTKNRYDVLPMAIMSVANQVYSPNQLHLTVFDDNDEPKDLREMEMCRYAFQMLDTKNISWDVKYGAKKGQHHNHQVANRLGYDFVWRLDDDCVPEPYTLSVLMAHMKDDVGAVGGHILTPPLPTITQLSQAYPNGFSSLIDDLDTKANLQWSPLISSYTSLPIEVDHLHCSFLYRAGIVDYDLRLSKKAHREETMFTYSLKLKGYKILVAPCITWHFKATAGGIRSDNDINDYQHDEWLFRKWLEFKKTGKKLFILNCGLGDHYMFMQSFKPDPNSVVACCYPDVMTGWDTISIADAWNLDDIEHYNVYAWAAKNNWKGSMVDAFRRFYEDFNRTR